MKIYIYILGALLFVCTNMNLYAQNRTNLNPTDDFTYEKHQATVEPTETLSMSGGKKSTATISKNSSATSGIGETLGSLSVSLTGGAEYNVPISVPPGINGVAPKLAINYNSQSGNGIAGWGWNIAGLSSITRIPSTQYHDGIIDPVDMDQYDRFALDGQRLIVTSGTYGADGATYQTENYSNVKITSHGRYPYNAFGPAYFKVYYPDGSIAYYGLDRNSKSDFEYALTFVDNPQGIRIYYTYIVHPNDIYSLNIDKIAYGSRKGTTPINEIRFEYGDRARIERAYVAGRDVTKRKILNKIKVFANGVAYRNYLLHHNSNELGFNRVNSIQERTGDEIEAHSAIIFSYNDTSTDITHTPVTANLGVSKLEQRNAETVSLDLTGNGKMDFIVLPKEDKTKFWIFKGDRYQLPYTVNTTSSFEHIFPTTWLNHNNKILSGQGVTVVQNSSNNNIDFKVYSDGAPIQLQYTKTWDAPTYIDAATCTLNTAAKRMPQNFLSGDFNGDGLTDVIAIRKPFKKIQCNEQLPCDNNDPLNPNCCTCGFSNDKNPQVNFINLDRRVTSNFVVSVGKLEQPIEKDDKLLTSDFNGDGKTDVAHISALGIYVYSLNSYNNALELLWHHNNSIVGLGRPWLVGDFNGDGKADLMNATYNGSKSFKYYLSKGYDFYVGNNTSEFAYNETNYNTTSSTLYGYNLIPVDMNGDGRTDIIEYNTLTYNDKDDGFATVKIYYNKADSEDTQYPQFKYGGVATVSKNLKHFPIPIFLSPEQHNGFLEFATISNQWIHSFKFNKDHRKDVALAQVSQNGVNYNIEYGEMVDGDGLSNGDVYTRGADQVYPYVDIAVSPGTRLVHRIERSTPSFTTPILVQDFYYKGAVSHLGGMGFKGFQYTSRSNWHTDAGDRIYSNTTFDPTRMGIAIENSSTRYSPFFESLPSDYIHKTNNVYEHTLSDDKVFKIQLTSSTTQNRLDGTNTTTRIVYDTYNNPKQHTVNHSGHGSTVTQNTYLNSTGSSYYIGRPASKKITSTIAGNSFSSEEQYIYTAGLVTTKKTKGNGTQFNTETYTYDVFGNILSITETPSGEASRVSKFKYDSSGRFIVKSTDIEGLEKTFRYNTSTGNLIRETDPFNHSTGYSYDKWDRITKVIDHLGNTLTTKYEESGFYYTVTNTANDGSSMTSLYDPLKRKINDRSKGLDGQWRQVTYQYDKQDRLIQTSEPHFGNSPTQWNTIDYDLYDRVKQQSLYTGKTISYTYNGLSITVNDGTKIVTTTKDAMGNVTKVDDPGGSILYTYFGNGELKSVSYGGTTQTIEQDGWGRKTKLTDPSAGVYTYTYNGYGELTNQTNPKGSTDYTYLPTGRISQSKVKGDQTDMTTNYIYDVGTKLVKSISATDAINSKVYSYTYAYDNYQRPKSIDENTGTAQYEKKYTYDNYGRIKEEFYTAQTAGKSSSSNFTHTYDSNGVSTGITNWQIKAQNARGQITNIQLGTGDIENNQYDMYGYLKKTTVVQPNATENYIDNSYNFNVQRGTLTSRTHSINVKEHSVSYLQKFEYDSMDRLTRVRGPFAQTLSYDQFGRPTRNSSVGFFTYDSGNKRYQLKEMKLNDAGASFYQNRARQQITYNAFKKPVEIDEAGKGKVSFEYGPMQNRVQAWYGGEQTKKEERRYQKYYSSIIPAEIVHDKQQDSYKFIFFQGGDAYSAPTVKIEKNTGGVSDGGAIYHLQRDYLGSILNIIKQVGDGSTLAGELVEHRQFGAWGTVDVFWSKDSEKMGHDSLLDRGYTGHEHFFDISLIHMNGRMYDPQLGRFLSPDNYIQNPYNTQNFNRYGYVLNNPLSYNDPSGELAQGIEQIPLVKLITAGLGLSVMAGSVVVGKWDDWHIGDWLGTNAQSIGSDLGNLFKDATNILTAPLKGLSKLTKGLFNRGGRVRASVTQISQGYAIGDPLMHASPTIAPVHTSIGGAFQRMGSGFSRGFTDQFVAIKTLFTNPSVLLRSPTLAEAALSSLENGPGTKNLVLVYKIMTAAMSGNPESFGYIYGAQAGQATMDFGTAAVGAGIGRAFSRIAARGSGLVDDLVRVRHHTSSSGLKGIKNSGSINASRGKPYGVDVEVTPFLKPTNVNLGQAGRGSYIEFSIPRSQLTTPPGFMGGTGNAGRIVTDGAPLNLSGSAPRFVRWNWLGF